MHPPFYPQFISQLLSNTFPLPHTLTLRVCLFRMTLHKDIGSCLTRATQLDWYQYQSLGKGRHGQVQSYCMTPDVLSWSLATLPHVHNSITKNCSLETMSTCSLSSPFLIFLRFVCECILLLMCVFICLFIEQNKEHKQQNNKVNNYPFSNSTPCEQFLVVLS